MPAVVTALFLQAHDKQNKNHIGKTEQNKHRPMKLWPGKQENSKEKKQCTEGVVKFTHELIIQPAFNVVCLIGKRSNVDSLVSFSR